MKMKIELNGTHIACENTLSDARRVLTLISEGYPYSLETLGIPNYYIILVENPEYQEDNESDPLLGLEVFVEV